VIFTLWNLWKERNRIIFNDTHESALQVASRVKEDISTKEEGISWEEIIYKAVIIQHHQGIIQDLIKSNNSNIKIYSEWE
jgi:hypothetical protein